MLGPGTRAGTGVQPTLSMGTGTISRVSSAQPIVAIPDTDGAGWLRRLHDDGSAAEQPIRVEDLAQAVREAEPQRPRWVLATAAENYPELLAAGAWVERCHDLAMAEALLVAYDGQAGAPHGLAAASARMRGEPVLDDPPPMPDATQSTLFEPDRSGLPPGPERAVIASEVYADQLRRIAATEHPERFRLLVAADSASALTAVEMRAAGVPWSAEIHDRILTGMLGERPPNGIRPPKLAALANQINAAFGRQVNPDSPREVIAAFAAAGHSLESTHSHVLAELDHPAGPLLVSYRELSRIHTAHGWAWLAERGRGGRFRPEYIPAGVVSGRWASRGGGALQIPRRLRQAVVADPGHLLVVADAGQLEPRVLAAMSGDPAMTAAASDDDMYAALAAEAFGGDRAVAKVGLISAMYGQTGGQAAAPLATLRRRYPAALDLLETAARAGETGRIVRSHLGRTSPAGPAPEPESPAARSRGRFTRNFVVQATAAEWAAALLACLRLRLAQLVTDSGERPELVFFQHDEIVAHVPEALAEPVVDAMPAAARDATRLLFGDTQVRFPLHVNAVRCYADGH